MMEPMARKATLSDQIRAAVDDSGMSRYRICLETGIDQASMSRFMAGKAGLTLDRIDRLAALLDLRVVSGPGKRRRAK